MVIVSSNHPTEMWFWIAIQVVVIAIVAPYTTSKHFRSQSSVQNQDVFTKDILMPNVQPTKHDAYLCTAQTLETKEAFIVQLEAIAEARKAHHILLFGCSSVSHRKLSGPFWECTEGALCEDMKILFAWAKNAAPTSLPKDVGFRIGSDSKINHLILQVHYVLPLSETDNSGLRLHITYQPQKYIAGIFLLVGMQTSIPPHKTNIFSDINCKFNSQASIHPFAYRVHAHKLGTVISGYKVSPKDGSWTLLGKGNPQWPQAARCTYNSSKLDTWTYIGSTANDEMCNFYIMYYTDAQEGISFDSCVDTEFSELVSLMPPDSYATLPPNPLLEEHALGMASTSTVHYESPSNKPSPSLQHSGDVHTPNFAVDKKGHVTPSNPAISYPDYDVLNVPNDPPFGQGSSGNLYDVSRGHVHHEVPSSNEPGVNANADQGGSDEPISGAQHDPKFLNWFSTPAQLDSLYKDVPDWPAMKQTLGQVTGASFDSNGNVVIFHRGAAIWGFRTFDLNNGFQGSQDKPISTDTVLTLNKNTGDLISSWGKNLFFLPHGIALDSNDNIWITDVALHQVIKYPAGGSNTPLLTLGERFVPGSDNNHFCKPSSVAILTTGEFFIADGYCNSRILKYSSKGELLLQWGQQTSSILGFKVGIPPPYAFNIPHRLALAEDKGLILVADRENGRIQCFYSSNGTFHSEIKDEEFGGRLFAMSYSSAEGGTVYAVNGPAAGFWKNGVKGFVIKLDTRQTVGYFTPSVKAMSNPHDIISTPDGSYLYVAEIGPNRIWKYAKEGNTAKGKQVPSEIPAHPIHPSTKDGIIISMTTPAVPTAINGGKLSPLHNTKVVHEGSEEQTSLMSSSNFAASMIIMALLAIPILLMILVAVFIRLKKQGKLSGCNIGYVKGWMTGYKNPNMAGFGFGNILNPHKGFDPVSMEDSDIDPDASDSDVEEFSAKVPKA